MASLNEIKLIGNLGRDAETRFTTSNKSVTSFSVATTQGYKDQSGNWQNKTTWHNVVLWEASDYLKEHLKKGANVYVSGRQEHREYTDKENQKKRISEVIANTVQMLIGKETKPEDTAENYTADNPEAKEQPSDDSPF